MNFELLNIAKAIVAFTSPSLTLKHEESILMQLNIKNKRTAKTGANAETSMLNRSNLMETTFFGGCHFNGEER